MFSTRSLAIAACRNERYFIFPATPDTEEPDETAEMRGVEYPLAVRLPAEKEV